MLRQLFAKLLQTPVLLDCLITALPLFPL